MLKKSKKLLKITLIIVLVLVIIRIVFVRSVTVASRSEIYVNDYNEFYLYKKDIHIKPFLSMGGGASPGYKVWFLLWQRGNLLRKIKEEVNIELEDMVADNSDIFKGYEIRGDFKKVYVYYYKDAYNYDLNRESAHRIYTLANKLTIELKVELYHEFIHGYGNSAFHENILELVEVDESLP